MLAAFLRSGMPNRDEATEEISTILAVRGTASYPAAGRRNGMHVLIEALDGWRAASGVSHPIVRVCRGGQARKVGHGFSHGTAPAFQVHRMLPPSGYPPAQLDHRPLGHRATRRRKAGQIRPMRDTY